MRRSCCAALLLTVSLACHSNRCWGAVTTDGETALENANNPSVAPLAEAARLLAAGEIDAAHQLVAGLADSGEDATERDFLDGMISYAGRDYHRAETMFRRILDRDPRLLRVRLELARTLYMERKDEQADYHFRLAEAARPSETVMRNILRFREAMRARRSWRFNLDFGFAPDSNINSATNKQTVDIYGLPFQLDPGGRARSGVGHFMSGDASIRLNRSGRIPIYIDGFGRWLRYGDHRFDDSYAGGDIGPEFQLGGGQLRATATGLMRWYGGKPLVRSLGGRFEYDRLVRDKWTAVGTLLARRNDYAGRSDLDGLDVEARAAANRPLGPTILAFGYLSVERNWAKDPGQAFWRGQLGFGILKEIGWGLRPQLSIDLARQAHQGELAPFGKVRRDWLMEGSFSIYKRDWNLGGFAPSVSVTMTRNRSTLTLYEEKRFRAEVRMAKAF